MGLRCSAWAQIRACLFDDFVRTSEYRWRNCQSKGLGGVEIHHQLKGCRLLYRQFAGPGALEYLSYVNAGLTTESRVVDSITDEAASRDKRTTRVHRWYGMTTRQPHDLLQPA